MRKMSSVCLFWFLLAVPTFGATGKITDVLLEFSVKSYFITGQGTMKLEYLESEGYDNYIYGGGINSRNIDDFGWDFEGTWVYTDMEKREIKGDLVFSKFKGYYGDYEKFFDATFEIKAGKMIILANGQFATFRFNETSFPSDLVKGLNFSIFANIKGDTKAFEGEIYLDGMERLFYCDFGSDDKSRIQGMFFLSSKGKIFGTCTFRYRDPEGLWTTRGYLIGKLLKDNKIKIKVGFEEWGKMKGFSSTMVPVVEE